MIAERRAKAFTAGTVGAVTRGADDEAARSYATEAAKVLQAYLHAAALPAASLNDVLSERRAAQRDPAEEILRTRGGAASFWDVPCAARCMMTTGRRATG